MQTQPTQPPQQEGQALDDAIYMTTDDAGSSDPAALVDKWTTETSHEGARRLFRACPWTRNIPILGDNIAAFGPKFTASIGGFYFMNNGLAENIISASKQPMMMKRYQIDATRYQRLAGVVTMGSSIKVLMATVSDTFAIFGYRKRWYQLGSCVVGFCFCLGYALLPAKPSSADTAAAFIFLCTFCRMNSDILTQGYYSRMIRRTPKAGPQLVTWIYWMILIATLVAAVLMGPLADQNKTVDGIFVSAVMHLLPGIIFLCNGYSEKPNLVERVEDARRLREDLERARRVAAMAAAAAAGDVAPAVGNVTPSEMSGEDVQLGIPQKHSDPHLVTDGLVDPLTGEALVRPAEGEAHDALTKKPTATSPNNNNNNNNNKIENENAVATLNDDGVLEAEWNDEEQVNHDLRSYCGGNLQINRDMVLRNWKIVAYSVLMIACVITMACMTILGTTWDLLYACIAVAVACIGGAFVCLPRVIAKTEVAVFLDFVLYIQLPGALDSFYLADEACLPGGPHFTYSFYTTVGAVITNIAGMVGVTLFAYVFSKHSFQMVMCTTVVLRMIASIFDLVMVERWNLAIGIPDHAMYIFGDSIIFSVTTQLNFLPLVLVLSRVVPPGSEAMVYALMSSIGNLGMTMSNTIGSLLIELAWPVDTKSTPCNFSNVPWLIITGHLLVPILIIPVSYIFLPRARMCDDIDMNGRTIKKHLSKDAEKKKEHEAAPAGKGVRTTASEPLHETASD